MQIPLKKHDFQTKQGFKTNPTSCLHGNRSVDHNTKLSKRKCVIDNINNKYLLMYLHNRDEFRCSRKVSSSFYTNGTRRVTQVTNPVIRHEWGNDQEVPTTFGTYFRSDELYLTNRKPWLSNVLFGDTSLSKKLPLEPQALEYRINWEIYTPYENATGMVLNINGKFTKNISCLA